MTESIFTRVFPYRQRENHSPVENFLTEVFAFCLENDKDFRKTVFQSLLGIELQEGEFKVSTQQEYSDYGRPDIEIYFNDTILLFECKVESGEGKEQLSKYTSILINEKQKYANKHLVFLTKYFEHKEQNNSAVIFHPVRWFNIYELIKDSHNEITKELKSFLKEQNMEKIKNFTIQDLLTMKSMFGTLSKMDELLKQFKPIFEQKLGGYSKAAFTDRLRTEYTKFTEFKYVNVIYHLYIGFFWDDDEKEIPRVGIQVFVLEKNLNGSDLQNILDKALNDEKGWDFSEWETGLCYDASKPITEFITENDDNIPSMKKFIEGHLQAIYDIQKESPQLFIK